MMPKLYITFKTPDAVDDAIKEFVEREEAECAYDPDMDEEERENIKLNRIDELKLLCKRWISCGEYVSLEIDTEEGTIKVAGS